MYLKTLFCLGFALFLSGCGGSDRAEEAYELLEQGNVRKAVRLLEGALRSDPDNASLQANLGIAYRRQGELEDAVVTFKRAADLVPDDPRPRELIGQCQVEQRDWEAARLAFLDAKELDRGSARVYNWLAFVEKQLHNESGARERLMHAMTEDPDYAPALYNMASLLRREAMTAADADMGDRAARTAERYYQRFLDSVGVDAVDSDRSAKARGYLKALAIQRQRWAEGAAEVGTTAGGAGAVADVVVPPVNAAARALLEKAHSAMERQEYDTALSLLKNGLKDFPKDPDIVWTLARLYGDHLGSDRHEARVMKSFRQRFPNDPRGREERIQDEPAVLSDPGSTGTRVDPVAETLQRKSKALDLWATGLRHHQSQDYDAAMNAYREALVQDPECVQAAYNLGLVCKIQGQLEASRDAFEQAVKGNGEMVEANYMLGVIYRELKQNGKALEQLSRVLTLDSNYAHAHFLLGLIYRDEKRPDMVRYHMGRYLQLDAAGKFAENAETCLRELR